MKNRLAPPIFWTILLPVFLHATIGLSQAATVPPTDNVSGPYFGVYEWSPSSAGFASRVDTLKSWLSRSTVWIEEFESPDSWANIAGPGWALNPARDYLNAHPGTVYVLTVPMLPWDPNNHANPLPGTSLAIGVSGTYNSYFATLAQNLVGKTLADGTTLADHTVIRLGHEFTGNWYPWKVLTVQDAQNFAAYWRQIHGAMKGVSGTANLKFCWNGTPGWTSYTLSDAYPGDAYVDYVGVDIYDQSWAYYPPADASTRPNAWNYDYAATYNNGLMVWKNFAASRGKPLAIPEWGTNKRSVDNHGGLDNTYFIQKMYDFIQDPANNVAFHIYFDIDPSDQNNHQLSPAGGYATHFPNAAALFQQLFTPPSESSQTRSPQADTYVRYGPYAGSNFGTETAMMVKLDAAEYTRENYLRFDVSGLAGASSVKIKLMPVVVGATGSTTTLSFTQLSSDNWTETGVTWNNRPTAGAAMTSITGFAVNQPIEVDVTNQARAEAGGDGILSIRIVSTGSGSQKYVSFGTKENVTMENRPVLTYVPSNTARTAVADTLVRNGAYADTNFGADATMTAKLDTSPYERECYMRFDVSGLATASNVRLVAAPTSLGADAATTTLCVAVVADDGWTETGLTWNNRTTAGNLVTTMTGGYAVGQPIQVDLTSYANVKAAGNGLLSIRIYSTTPGTQRLVTFGTRENSQTSNRPVLQVTP